MQSYTKHAKDFLDFIDNQCAKMADTVAEASSKISKEDFATYLDLFLKTIAVVAIIAASVIVAVNKGHTTEAANIKREEQRMTDTGDEISGAVLQSFEADKKAGKRNLADNATIPNSSGQQKAQTSGGQ